MSKPKFSTRCVAAAGALGLALLAVPARATGAHAAPSTTDALAPTDTVHLALQDLAALFAARLSRAERAQLAAVDASNTRAGDTERIFLAAVDGLRPAVGQVLEAADLEGAELDAVRAALPVTDRRTAAELAVRLEAAAARGDAEADQRDAADAETYCETLRVAAALARRAAELARTLGAGVDAADEGAEDLDELWGDLAAILDDATALIGRRGGVRAMLQIYRQAVAAGRASDAPATRHVVTVTVEPIRSRRR